MQPPAPDQWIPAHRERRRVPLPWCNPKPADEDPDAPRRVQAILDSPSYRQADLDTTFLGEEDTRGVRLQIDYLKAELLLEHHHVTDTIVVFGGTRIPEPMAAQRRLHTLRQEQARRSEDADLRRRVRIAERLLITSRYYDVARELGRLVGASAQRAERRRLLIVTGAGPGIMEAANRGAFDVEANSIGLNVALPTPQYPNPYVTPDLCFRFHYFSSRKLHFLLRARALVAFPGGYGTLDELFETLTLVQTRAMHPVPVVLVGESYWRRAIDVDFLADEGMIDPEDRELFCYAETAAEIWSAILGWHERNGTPLCPPA
jgi:uncharacterized protein (TIGR00730 family)